MIPGMILKKTYVPEKIFCDFELCTLLVIDHQLLGVSD